MTTEITKPSTLKDLITTQNVSKYTDETVLSEVAKSRSFLPFIKIASANCKEVAGKDRVASAGDFILQRGKEDKTSIGNSFDCIPFSVRVKAVDNSGEKLLSYFDPSTPEFAACKEKSKDFDSGCMSGVEVLLWLPEYDTFATYYCNNVTALNEVQSIRARTGLPSKLKTTYIESKKYSWYGPKMFGNSETLVEPDIDYATTVLNDFNNPKSSEAVLAEEGEGSEERAR